MALGKLYKGHRFADLLCHAYGKGAFVVLGRVGNGGNSLTGFGDWAGPIPEGESRAPYVAHAKMNELFNAGSPYDLSMTPILGFKFSLGWKGGVRFNEDIVAVSKWDQHHDKLLALMILYSLNHDVQLHHFGWHYPSRDAALAADSRTANTFVAHEVNAEGESWYYLVEDDRHPRGFYYLEHQCGQGGLDLFTFHWDVVVNNPGQFLEFIASAYGEKPEFFKTPRESDPVGAVWVVGDDHSFLGVTARANWWEVK